MVFPKQKNQNLGFIYSKNTPSENILQTLVVVGDLVNTFWPMRY